jgi:arginase
VPAELIAVPYVLGREGTGMGAGPLALLDAGAGDRLGGAPVTRLALTEPFGNEVGACFDLNRQVATAVAATLQRGALPVVLTGNCHTQQAVVAGVGPDRGLGLIWFDCHADFHTPDTTTSGFFDGCGLAMTVGHCWRALCATVPGFAPLAEEQVLLAGARDFDAGEHGRLVGSDVIVVGPHQILGIEERLGDVERVSLHVDLDVLDPSQGVANRYATAPGVTRDELLATLRMIVEDKPVAALTLSAYDPSYDGDGRVRDVALEILELVSSSGGS